MKDNQTKVYAHAKTCLSMQGVFSHVDNIRYTTMVKVCQRVKMIKIKLIREHVCKAMKSNCVVDAKS